ncbi:MAG: pilus assembly protein TadB [Planctomycetota bacterium]|nr:MAG: pilus assembly protein TadB [Planctomycetota bacterium]REK37269.1 MAG: pilus assembly protein TadB [Planctomycetota bacterium]
MAAPTLQARPEFAGILRQQETFAVDDSDSFSNRINSGFDRLMIQAGAQLSPAMVLMLCVCCAIAVGGLLFVIHENLLTTALAACLGAAIPIVVTIIVRARRQKLFLQQMPAMMDELARAAKTGRSLENCLELVAEDTPQPLGGELRRCTKRLQLGMSIGDAMSELPLRTGLTNANVLVTALRVHRESGGDLVKVLERLAQTLRDRIQFQGRLRAATAASRATALLMVIVPPAVLVYFSFREADYLSNLMNSEWGRTATITAVLLQMIGTIWVFRILKRSSRG